MGTRENRHVGFGSRLPCERLFLQRVKCVRERLWAASASALFRPLLDTHDACVGAMIAVWIRRGVQAQHHPAHRRERARPATAGPGRQRAGVHPQPRAVPGGQPAAHQAAHHLRLRTSPTVFVDSSLFSARTTGPRQAEANVVSLVRAQRGLHSPPARRLRNGRRWSSRC